MVLSALIFVVCDIIDGAVVLAEVVDVLVGGEGIEVGGSVGC